MMSGQQHQHCSVSGYYCCCYWVYAVFAVWGDWSVDRLNARQAIGFSIAYSLATLDDFCSPEWHEFSVNHFSAIVNWFGKKQTSDLWNSKQAYMLHVFYNFVFFVHIFIFSPLSFCFSLSLSSRSGQVVELVIAPVIRFHPFCVRRYCGVPREGAQLPLLHSKILFVALLVCFLLFFVSGFV